MENILTDLPEAVGILELSAEEVRIVSGGLIGYHTPDGLPFTYWGPNGVPYEVLRVTSHYMDLDGGGREYFVDCFATQEIPLPDLQTFLNQVTWYGFAPQGYG